MGRNAGLANYYTILYNHMLVRGINLKIIISNTTWHSLMYVICDLQRFDQYNTL